MSDIANINAALILTALGVKHQKNANSVNVLQKKMSLMSQQRKEAIIQLLHTCGSYRNTYNDNGYKPNSAVLALEQPDHPQTAAEPRPMGGHPHVVKDDASSNSTDSGSEYVYPELSGNSFRKFARYLAAKRHRNAIVPVDEDHRDMHPGVNEKLTATGQTGLDMIRFAYSFPFHIKDQALGTDIKHIMPREDYFGGSQLQDQFRACKECDGIYIGHKCVRKPGRTDNLASCMRSKLE